MDIPPLGPDQDDVTHASRQAVVNSPQLLATMAETATGRMELRKHRAIASQKLRTETDWREICYATYMLHAIDAVLAPKPKRKRAVKRKARPRLAAHLSSFRDDVRRIQTTTGLASELLSLHTLDETHSPALVLDLNEALIATRKAASLAETLAREIRA
ncbi:hypothetical protein SAMN02800694_2770 [Luteibacter sp. UNCMF331Sha3.1]|uniref:hypothetical protein n=1 Tax=Luteibacter sp. UNCMF331Sha3.1 TaxID=1502760 RepID=UPI0008D3FBAD|nr:hypothetical protein [Luteibacter sp. UNCMF331Sha3.1]SEN10010.1 hypothetical protein SAMN02800694_2770 [Luteibacter sp. UNCMF331Sha3.1]